MISSNFYKFLDHINYWNFSSLASTIIFLKSIMFNSFIMLANKKRLKIVVWNTEHIIFTFKLRLHFSFIIIHPLFGFSIRMLRSRSFFVGDYFGEHSERGQMVLKFDCCRTVFFTLTFEKKFAFTPNEKKLFKLF